MNFSLLAVTMALATSSVAAGRPVRKHMKLGNRNLRKNSPVARALMKKARPYKPSLSGVRKLEENGIDGSYNLKFSQCVDIKTYDQDNFANYADQISAGTVVPTKSYVLFHVCTDATCGYDAEDDLYIVDLPTYLATVATFHAEKKGKYCEACNEFQDFCNPEEEEEEEAVGDDAVAGDEEEEAADEEAEDEEAEQEEEPEEEDEAEDEEEEGQEEENNEGEGEGRKLKKTQRRTKEAIDCDQCQAYECYAEDDGDDQGDLDEQAAEWIKQVAECQQSEIQVNGVDVFYGAMCDDYGDGVELAVFLDEECTLYTTEVAFDNIYMKEEGNDAYNYLTYAENYIKSAFSDAMSCYDPEYFADNGDEEANDEEEKYEINEYCEEILKDDAVDYTQCEADEDAQQLVTDDGYAYDMAYDKDLDIEEVCAVVKRMENSGEYYNAYDSSSSGSWYKRDKSGKIIVESKGSDSGLSGGAIFGIIALIAVVVGGAAFAVMKKKEKKGDIAESAEYQGGALS